METDAVLGKLDLPTDKQLLQGEYDAFIAGARLMVEQFDSWVVTHQVRGRADHICYKCGSHTEYEGIRTMLRGYSDFIFESTIPRDHTGRSISIIRLKEPLLTRLGTIEYVELSDQKQDCSQRSGFDHIEIYPVERGTSAQELATELEERGLEFIKAKRAHHATFDTFLSSGSIIRIEGEPLVEKIALQEMLRRT